MKFTNLGVMKKFAMNVGGMFHWRIIVISLLMFSMLAWPVASTGGSAVLDASETTFA